MAIKRDKDEVIKTLEEKYGDKFEILIPDYQNTHSEVQLKCKKCNNICKGRIYSILNDQYQVQCKYCKREEHIDKFIELSTKAHNGEYIYNKEQLMREYVYNNTEVTVTCPKHGDFKVRPVMHQNGNMKCPRCNPYYKEYHAPSKEKQKYTTEYFKERVKSIHDDKYKVLGEYTNARGHIKMWCEKHQEEFISTPHDILRGHGCPKCGVEQSIKARQLNIEDYINKCTEVHKGKYIYDDKLGYKSLKDDIHPICPIHGRFSTNAGNHLNGYGACPFCNTRRTYHESEFGDELKEKYSDIIFHYTNPTTLKRKHFDYYIPSLRIAIEYQGEQHFRPIPFFGGKKMFQKQIKRDLEKIRICAEEGITLLFYSPFNVPDDFTYYNVIKNKEDLFNIIDNISK